MARTPIWKDIERQLTAEIGQRRFAPGDKLPTEAELSARFGVNRHTVRRALAEMQDKGLTHSRRGAGVFVAATAMEYQMGRRVRFSENLERAGLTGERVSLRFVALSADQREAEALKIDPGDPVLISEGVSLADGSPISVGRSAFPIDRLPGIEDALCGQSSVTAALAEIGISDYTRAWTEVTAVLATATQAVHLRVHEGAALLRSVSLNVDPEGAPVEYGRTWFVGDRIRLKIDPD
ncbi:MAG: phosphonate metabolism transcriptional regulator PhnF [Pseudomonadota bacterium]